MNKIFSLLYYSIPAEYVSCFSPDESARRLRANIKASLFLTLFRASAVGISKPEKVVLYWTRPFFSNSFIPIFKGKFIFENGKTVLVGKYSMHFFVKAFMSFWFGAILLAVITSLYHFVVNGFSVDRLYPILFASGMLSFGVLLVIFGRLLARNDINLIANVINASLGSERI